jgi:membrane-anchored glycerophosphoryl diester phosphodiesterase (GDPDase)
MIPYLPLSQIIKLVKTQRYLKVIPLIVQNFFKLKLASSLTAQDKFEAQKMENNNKKMSHIRRTTHIMKMAHRSCFNFAFYNSK